MSAPAEEQLAEIFFEPPKLHALILLVKFFANAIRRIIDLVFAVGRRREKFFSRCEKNFLVVKQELEKKILNHHRGLRW